MGEEPQQGDEGGWKIVDWYQAGVLSDRYMEMVLGNWKNTGLLILQAPALAYMAVLVWENTGRPNPQLYFVMVLSMFWIGCMNACREIVKERDLFLREKMFGLDIGAYLYSKLRVLAMVGAVQVVIYAVILEASSIDVRIRVGWVILILLATMLCAIALGLLISAMVKRTDHAVFLVPLVIIPQLIFSEFTISEDSYEGLSQALFYSMPARWSHESLMHFADHDFLQGAAHAAPLLGYCALFLLIAYPILRMQRY